VLSTDLHVGGAQRSNAIDSHLVLCSDVVSVLMGV